MQRLIENIVLKADNYKKVERPLTESEQNLLVEGTPYKALAIYRFEFTRPGEKNLNGRIYPYALWDRILSDPPVTLALMDHPAEGAGNPKDVWAVVRDPKYSDDRKKLTADAYIIDNENGRSALGVLEAGGDLGLSSSGYGDFLPDGITVDPDTFQLERYFDWVLQPSYEVYGHQQDKVGESTQESNNKNDIQEKEIEMTLKEKKDYELSLKKLLAEATAIQDFKERFVRIKEAISFCEEAGCDAIKAEFEKLALDTAMEMANSPEPVQESKKKESEPEKKDDRDDEKGKETDDVKDDGKDADDKGKDDNKKADDDKEKDDKKDDKKEESSLQDKEKIVELEKDLAKKESTLKEYEELVRSFTKDASNKIAYEDYSKLREFAERAVRLLAAKREQIEILIAQNKELSEKLNLSEGRLIALANKHIAEETRVRTRQEQVAEARRENERKIQESRERELVESANPQVLSYYNDLVARGEDVQEMREEILKKKTLFEAQTYFLRHKKHTFFEEQSFSNTDLSAKIGDGRGTQVNSEIKLPKGFI